MSIIIEKMNLKRHHLPVCTQTTRERLDLSNNVYH